METQKINIGVLSLKKGDMLVIEKGFGHINWQQVFSDAARIANIDFDVPIVFVDDIEGIKVLRLEDDPWPTSEQQ